LRERKRLACVVHMKWPFGRVWWRASYSTVRSTLGALAPLAAVELNADLRRPRAKVVPHFSPAPDSPPTAPFFEGRISSPKWIRTALSTPPQQCNEGPVLEMRAVMCVPCVPLTTRPGLRRGSPASLSTRKAESRPTGKRVGVR